MACSTLMSTCEPDNYLGGSALPASSHEPHWYAAYTCANHEKRVAGQLEARDVEHFLPLYSSMRRWKDRRVNLELPLFPGYVFVRLALCERLRVVQIPGVVRLVGSNGQPTSIDGDEMWALQRGLEGGRLAEPWRYLTVGCRVRIKSGPLLGLEGALIRKKAIYRFVLSLHLIQRAVAVEVNAADLEAIR